MTVAARKEVCAECEGACERRHRDHKTYCYASDLQLDEGHWIGTGLLSFCPFQSADNLSQLKFARSVVPTY